MSFDWWSWTLTILLLCVLYLTGKRRRFGWMVGVFSQVLWVVYALTTKQYGFLVGAVLVGGMYVKNWIDWGKQTDGVKRYELEGYIYREYDFEGRTYRIDEPISFWWGPKSTTHRVLDSKGVVHIVPAPGFKGCVLRYEKKDGEEPVKF